MARQYDIIIIGGFGHVGLPLGIVLADVGMQVGLLDIDTSKRSAIESGTMPFIEYEAEPLLQKVIHNTLHVCDSLEDIKNTPVVLLTIGTPVDEYLSPKMRGLFRLTEEVLPFLREDACIVLRSTVFPGTSQALVDFCKGKDRTIHLAYCPERIVQGYAVRELKTLPQVISGNTDFALAVAKKVFEKHMGVETITVGLEEAELTKLFLNTWRYIQFAVGNQFYTMAKQHGLDYQRIYNAMTHNYERGKSLPRPGFAAGPCLLKDTMQLSAAFGNNFLLGHAAMMINEGLPSFVVQQILGNGRTIRGTNVGILGMAFKADIDDTRDSLSYKLRKILEFHGANVVCSDEFVNDTSFVSKEDLVEKCDTIVVAVPHSAYRVLKIQKGKYVVDLWGIVQHSSDI